MIAAPNLFTDKVDEVLVAQDIRPTCSEPKIYLNMGTVAKRRPDHVHRPGMGGGSVAARATLNMMVSAHMDDFKATGPQAFLNWLRDVLSKAFGGDVKMEQESSFIHTGIKHTRIDDKKSGKFHYVLDQIEYASAIKPVDLPELIRMKDEEPLQGFLHNCFMTLLGATAWVLQTRMDIAVYVSALQRRMQTARAIDLRRLNRVIRATQRNPQGLHYHQLPEPRVLLAVGDSAFQAPTEEEITEGSGPLVMRGYILAGVTGLTSTMSPPAHLLLLSLERLAKSHNESHWGDVAINSRYWIIPLASRTMPAAAYGPQSYTTSATWLKWLAL